jgi:2-phosphosulfolactate phosphatase
VPEVTFHPYALADGARGVVVVVDVLRAFTSQAYAFAAGARRIVLAPSAERALALKAADPEVLVLGEVDGRTPAGFDFTNSPVEIAKADICGRTLVHTSSAGVAATCRVRATELFVAGLVNAKATARAVRDAAHVSLVISGTHCGWDGDEDRACADLIAAELTGASLPHAALVQRVLASTPGRFLADPSHPEHVAGDLAACTAIDRFDFAMRVRLSAAGLVVTAERSET